MYGHILLCPNCHRDEGFRVTRATAALLRAEGHRVRICPLPGEGGELAQSGLEPESLADALPGAALLVTLGGDGTILLASRASLGSGVPILGVNLGHKGFLAQLESGELNRLREAAAGQYTRQGRMMLDVRLLRGGEVILHGCALNDAAINGIVNSIGLSAWGDGVKIMEISGDGLILSSPTGATGYSMSAGGPLVEPDAQNIILTPICAHQLAVRSFVLAPERVVTIRPVELHDKRALLAIDGAQLTPLQDGDEIRVARSANIQWMAQLSGKSFYDTAYKKLSAKS